MRISDWSSDVCSSDLALVQLLDRQRVKVLTLEIVQRVLPSARGELVEIHHDSVDPEAGDVNKTVELTFLILRQAGMTTTLQSTMTAIAPEGPGGPEVDRKTDVEGKRVTVRVDLGSRRIIRKKDTKRE